MGLLDCFYAFMTALFSSLIIVPFLRKWALDQGTLDQPDERKNHTTPMPRLGGIAIFLSFLFSVIVYAPITPIMRGLLAGGLIVFATGLVDDLTELTAKRKFAGQLAACLGASVIGDLWLTDLGNLFGLGDIVLPLWLAVPFTVFAMVGIINAINLIDGLDGLAGGTSVITLTAFFVIGWIDSDPIAVFVTAALGGSLLGFLKYNFYPARIFMGDAGSLTVGFVLGFLAINAIQQPSSSISSMVTVLVLAVPLFDTIWVMSKRIANGLSPFSADRTHVHHKFLDLGFEHRFTVLIIYGLTMFWASSALLMRTGPEYLLLVYLLLTSVGFYLGLRHVLRHPEQFSFLSRDATAGLRSSVTYLRIAEMVDKTIPALIYLLAGYLLMALWSTLQHNAMPWQVAPILLAIGIYLWYKPLTENRQFLMLILYVAVGMAAVEVWHADELLVSDLTMKRIGDILLGVAALIVIFKIQFRKQGEFFLTSADFLALAVCVFLAIASQKNVLGFNLNGPLFRAVVAIFMIRTLCSRKLPYYRIVAMMCFVFLALVGVLGLVS